MANEYIFFDAALRDRFVAFAVEEIRGLLYAIVHSPLAPVDGPLCRGA